MLSEMIFSESVLQCQGLVTAQDIMAQLDGKELGERLLLPCNMLKADDAALDCIIR